MYSYIKYHKWESKTSFSWDQWADSAIREHDKIPENEASFETQMGGTC